MRPSRHVRRADTRPRYTRAASAARRPVKPARSRSSRSVGSGAGFSLPSVSMPSLSFPAIQMSWLLWAAIAVVAVALLVTVSNLTRIQQIEVEGNENLNSVHIQQMAEEGIKQQWFGSNIILVQTGSIKSYLQENEPAIKQASVSRSGNHTLKVVIQERQPTLNWRSGNSLHLLDADGTVIGPSQGAYEKTLPTIIDGSSLPVEEGRRVAPAAFIVFASQLSAQLPSIGVGVVAITVPETTSELMVKTDKGYTLKFDTTRPVAGELADLQAVLKEIERSKKTPKEYIDLRIENKAYYK